MRFYTLVVSIAVHVTLVIVLVIVPLYALDALPGARQAIAFVQASAAELPDPPPPPRARSADQPPQQVARDTAPTHAPDRIEPEIERPRVERGVPFDGPGVPGDDPNGMLLPVVPVPPPPVAALPRRPGGDIRAPQKTKHVAPIYPAIARDNKVQGVVILEAVIGENGRVRNVRVLRSLPMLDQAAIDAVRQWQFTPTLLNGQPVPIVMTVTVSFELK